MFEYMMAGLPMLCSNLPEMRRVLEAHGLGVVLSELSRDGVQEGISRLRQMDYRRLVQNVNVARREFSWEAQDKLLLSAYGSLGV